MALAFFVGRLLFGGFFLVNGLNHLMSVAMMAQLAAAKGVPYPELGIILTGSLLVFGGLSIMAGWRPDLGVAALVFFLVAVPRPWIYSIERAGRMRVSTVV